MYQYMAEVIRHVDGDTIRLRVDVGFNMTFQDNFRLYGIDTPELRSSDPNERIKAQAASLRLAELCPVGSIVSITTYKADKYGRWLAEIFQLPEDDQRSSELQSVNSILVIEGHAKAYYGGSK